MQNNHTEKYSANNRENSVSAERFLMTSVSKKVYVVKKDCGAGELNNKYYATINMKFIDVNSSTYIDFVVENINKDFKPQVCELV